MNITFSQYDELQNNFENINSKVYWPNPNEILYFKKNEKWIKYAMFLLAKNPNPKNAEEKYSRKNLNDFINENVNLICPFEKELAEWFETDGECKNCPYLQKCMTSKK